MEAGQVWVDGQQLVEPYASASAYRGTFDVPECHYLLLGDNRNASSDARSWRNPFVGRDEIAGILIQTRGQRERDRSVMAPTRARSF